VAFPWPELGAIGAAAGAAAAWRSASASQRAVARAHTPFVFPDWRFPKGSGENEDYEWQVQLHNEGPGIALDVRWSFAIPEWASRGDRERETLRSRALASEAIRALRPGESSGWLSQSLPDLVTTEDWYMLVRYTDSSGVRWEYLEATASELARPVRRLRKVRRTRTLRERIRMVRRGPWRESVRVRERPDW
jgi:hypothetical protein